MMIFPKIKRNFSQVYTPKKMEENSQLFCQNWFENPHCSPELKNKTKNVCLNKHVCPSPKSNFDLILGFY